MPIVGAHRSGVRLTRHGQISPFRELQHRADLGYLRIGVHRLDEGGGAAGGGSLRGGGIPGSVAAP